MRGPWQLNGVFAADADPTQVYSANQLQPIDEECRPFSMHRCHMRGPACRMTQVRSVQ